MIIKSFRDVETEFRKFLNEVDALKRNSIGAGQTLSEAAVIALIKQYASRIVVNPTQTNTPQETDSAYNGGKIIHQLIHQFLQTTQFKSLNIDGSAVYGSEPWNDDIWLASPNTLTEFWHFFGSTANGVFLMKMIAGATEDVSSIYFKGVLGDNLDRVEKLYVKDIDVSGTATGISGDANNYKQAAASGNLALTTSFADITGATVTLDQNGDWLVIATFKFDKLVNDDQCLGRIDHDGSPLSPTAYFGEAVGSVALNLSGTTTVTKVVNVASQPDTLKLQACKNGGSGSSQAALGHTQISAVFLKP